MKTRELLQKPLEGLNNRNVQAIFKEIAENLFKKFCIQCGARKYYFAEIEFYYYEKESFEQEWNKVTYKRLNYNVGDFFYHLSGVDICFDSDEYKYGGILIRSIIDEKGTLIIGPLTCVNTLLNACRGDKMPHLALNLLTEDRSCSVKETFRYLGGSDYKLILDKNNKDKDLKLAFYDGAIIKEKWDKARPSYYSNRLTKFAK